MNLHRLFARRRWPAWALVGLAPAGLWAAEHPQEQNADGTFTPPPAAFSYLIGTALRNAPTYAGSESRNWRLAPAWSVAWGRFRIATGRANALMGYGAESVGSGATAVLVSTPDLRISSSLRYDSGRSSSDDPRLTGLPNVRHTLVGHLGLGMAVSPGWSLGLGVSQDLLGRDAGTQLDASLSRTLQWSPSTRWVASAGASVGSKVYMQSHFGVPDPAAAAGSALPGYNASAGLFNTRQGLDFTTLLSPHWVMYGGVGWSQLRGPARESPITVKPDSFSLSIGLAYRH